MMFYQCQNMTNQIEKEIYERLYQTGYLQEHDNRRTKRQVDVIIEKIKQKKGIQKIELGRYEYVKKFNYFFQYMTYYYRNNLIIYECVNIYGKGEK